VREKFIVQEKRIEVLYFPKNRCWKSLQMAKRGLFVALEDKIFQTLIIFRCPMMQEMGWLFEFCKKLKNDEIDFPHIPVILADCKS